MSTNATIGIDYGESGIESITVNYDGYLEHTGKILFDYYDSLKKAEALIKLGDLNSIGALTSQSPFTKIYGMDNDDPNLKKLSPELQDAVFDAEHDHCVAIFRDFAYKLAPEKQKSILGYSLNSPHTDTVFNEKEFFENAQANWSSYIYLFKNAKWYVRYRPDDEKDDVFEELEEALKKIKQN